MEEVKEMWDYECLLCGHITHFIVGGAQDIICHKCWNYSMQYIGKQLIDWTKFKESQ